MKSNGSVLIVVLGLLAVLSVVGVAFVTMSSIESNAAANFALQAQFDLAADGAVDYVTQALIRDVWEFSTDSSDTTMYRKYTGWMLTGKYGTWHWDWPDPIVPTPNVTKPTPDVFLATNWSTITQPTNPAFSFRTAETTATVTPYNLKWSGAGWGGTTLVTGNTATDGCPNNLGIPKSGANVLWYDPPNGLWIPELAFPFQGGVVRASVTVQDHAAMVNLNAHNTNDSWQPYGAAKGKGYFVSDLIPDSQSFPSVFPDLNKLLVNIGTPPGRWSASTNAPGNPRLGEIFFQNPGIAQDRPFTLDDEFELRRLTGTYAQSRLEQIVGLNSNLNSTPSNASSAKVGVRLGLTTVGWNAEVIPGQRNANARSVPKCDLNLAWDQGGTSILGLNTLHDAAVMNTTGTTYAKAPSYYNRARQFVANVLAFKERRVQTDTGKNYFELQSYSNLSGVAGARRQVIITKVNVGTRQVDKPTAGKDTLTVKVQLFAPWKGNYAGDTSNSMDVTNHRIKVYYTGGTKEYNLKTDGSVTSIPGQKAWPTSTPITIEAAKNFTIDKVTLEANGVPGGIIDQITSAATELGTTYPITRRRPVGVHNDEKRATNDSDPVTVVYVKNWTTGADNAWDQVEGGLIGVAKGAGIPIRFPHSVPYPGSGDPNNQWDTTKNGPLPPYTASSGDQGTKPGIFKAFLRVGDLNQVLFPSTEADATPYWPWITKVAVASGAVGASPTVTQEQTVKWDWYPSTTTDANAFLAIDRANPVYDSPPTPAAKPDNNKTQFRRYHAGNLFCVDSPWADSFDNDGDGPKDIEDTGADRDHGRFCGAEIRAAGRINLNTALDSTLSALGLSFATSSSDYTSFVKAGRPFTSPVEILRSMTTAATDPECQGPLEKRDFWYTRISNIATTRSDTFSIYGTVQYVIPGSREEAATDDLNKIKIVRTRRFWALVDRSPALTYAPTDTKFIHPRVMNFQWMD